MTPTQLKEYENEFFKEINEIITDYGFDDTTGKTKSHKFGHRELITHRKSYESATVCLYYENVWQFIESKLQAVEKEVYKKWKYHSHSGLSENFAVFMGWETAPDITMVYENGHKFIRTDKIEDYLKSNKLKK